MILACVAIGMWALVAAAALVDIRKLREREELEIRLQHHGRADLLDDQEWAAKGYSEIPDREGEDEDNDE